MTKYREENKKRKINFTHMVNTGNYYEVVLKCYIAVL